uniref:Scavenger receptor cysteine-rich type 1 protein M130-like n=1 Tax=Astatotilapia calliptera TaxID=8154 RepID=A0AAX7TZ92_ASTCA
MAQVTIRTKSRQGDFYLDMDHLLMLMLQLLLLLRSSEPGDVRLVGGASHCAGTLEAKHLGEWRPLCASHDSWTLKEAAVFCEYLDCGSAVHVEERHSSYKSAWSISSDCVLSRSPLRECTTSDYTDQILKLTCADSVRLLNGSSLCSGRLEVKSNQSWSSVCEDDFDQQDAEVVCRELGCGPPSVLQGALYGEVEAPVWSKVLHCGGHESALLDCRSSGSARNSCSPGKAVGLTCSESDFRLVGGASRCTGILEAPNLREWRPVYSSDWSLKETAVVCIHLGCGSAFSVKKSHNFSWRSRWKISSDCLQPGSPLRDCATSAYTDQILNLTCSDSVRLLNGSSLCSGRLEVKSNQSWSSVCEADFDQQDAEVVCRELRCGPPSVLQGALYGEVEAPVWSKEFQCGGHESALLDCRSSGSARNSCSPGKAVGLTCSEPDFRLVGGASRCTGTLEFKHLGEWRPVYGFFWTLKEAAVSCEQLDCGSAVYIEMVDSSRTTGWLISSDCVLSRSPLRDCATSHYTDQILKLTCSDSVRLLNGSSLCSGRLEVKSNQSWSSVCEADFDQQDAEVVCRELGCGPPSVLQGALYEEVEASVWSKEFQCGGHESALLDCRSSGSARNSCSPGKAVGLTCSEPVRLVGGASHCAGTLELKYLGEWRPVYDLLWSLKKAVLLCYHLDCGSAVSVTQKKESTWRSKWSISPYCVQPGCLLRECAISDYNHFILNITCSDSVRLLNGSSLCSGRLEVKSNQSWSSVCEDDFDQKDAEVVCREFGCGPPLVLQGAFYGEVEASVSSKEFQCGGHESALLDCRSSGSARNSCSPGKAVGLTCSESDDVRLVGGPSRCAGTLELKHLREWRPMGYSDDSWTLKAAAVVCEQLDCGSAVSMEATQSSYKFVWLIRSSCIVSKTPLSNRDCAISDQLDYILKLTCSDSVRLLNGSSLCSGRLEVKYNQSWSSVCEDDFDQQDAEVVCRQLGCGPPSVLQGALYEEVEASVWSKEFQCGGHESALLDCRSSGSARNSCSPGKAVGLTCSDNDVRLVGGPSRCAGTLELKHLAGWRPLCGSHDSWTLKEAAVFCEHLDCGSAVSIEKRRSSRTSAWLITPECVLSTSPLRGCATTDSSYQILKLTCSDFLVQPVISVSSMNGVSKAQQQELRVSRGSNFTISCSIQPQYPGGFFQLTFTSSNTAYNYTQPAVNHSAYFLFPAAKLAHQGNYSCVYHVYAIAHNFSSESRLLSVTVSAPTDFTVLITMLILPLTLLLVITALYFYCQASRGQKSSRQKNTELLDSNQGVCAGEGGTAANKGVQQDLQRAHPTAT